MTDEVSAQPSSEPAAAAPAEAPQSSPLEKVYTDFKIEDQAASFQPQAPATAQPATPQFKVPDAFDPNFPAYLQAQSGQVAQLNQALQQTHGKLTALEQQLHSRQVEADIKQAVGVVAEKSGISADLAEVALETLARKDPKFLQVWNNRQKNPKAFNAALNAAASEFSQRFAVKQDPQLVENQRAVAASRNQMATTQKTTEADAWGAMTASERQQKVQQMIRRG